jgi:hypothetical protein
MADRRESILVRLVEIAEAIDGIVLAARNKVQISERQRPAIIILDSDEVVDFGGSAPGKGSRAPSIVSMTPEILVLLQDNSGDVGTELNAFRIKVILAILNDATLLSLVGSNGAIRYEGCATGLSRGRNMEGEMGIAFSFLYPLIPAEMEAA